MSLFFSIIVPCFNTGKTVAATLDSIKNQTYDNYEIIAINDGSTDNTMAILEKYRKENSVNLRIISQSNKGLGGARNAGIKNAHSSFIAFLDADDLWYPQKLLKINNVFESHRNVDDDLLFNGNCLSGSAIVVKKDKLFEVGLFTENRSFHGVEDYDMWMKLALVGANFYYLHEFLGGYVLHENNMTNDIESFMKRGLSLMKYHFDNYPQKDLRHRFMFRVACGQTMRGTARQFLHCRDYKKAKRYAFESLKMNIFSLKTLLIVFASIAKIKI
jgi:glycosyltransferase involved in cell wall biosynthesis